MPLVITGVAFGLLRPQRQDRLRAVERQHRRLLIDAQDHGPIWRSKVELDDVAHLVDEQRIGEKLKVINRIL